MANKLSLTHFLQTINIKKYQKDIKLRYEVHKIAKEGYSLKLKDMEISKELFKELKLKEKKQMAKKTKKTKQISTRDLLLQFINNQEQFNKEQRQFNQKISQFMEEQTKFNKQQLKFNQKQEKFNLSQQKVNQKQKMFNQMIAKLPTIKKEKAQSKQKTQEFGREI